MTVEFELKLDAIGKADPREVCGNLPPGASELVSQLLAVAIGMKDDEAAVAEVPICDQKALKKLLRKAVSTRVKKKNKSAREFMMMTQFRVLLALNVGSREMLKSLVSNMSEDCGELIKEFEAYRESHVGRA